MKEVYMYKGSVVLDSLRVKELDVETPTNTVTILKLKDAPVTLSLSKTEARALLHRLLVDQDIVPELDFVKVVEKAKKRRRTQ